jgi:hydrogenase maturation protease
MLIIGLGNPDRGDDAAGILVACRLVERGIAAIEHRGDPLDLIQMWQNADCAVIVDAVISGATPGTVHVWEAHITDLRDKMFRSSTHVFGLADAIELARTLGSLPKKLTIYGIEAAHFLTGAPPSPQVLTGIEHAVEQIASRLAPRATRSSL